MSHVIAAVSTGASVSAIGIIRLSGDGCIAVADKVFTLNSGKSLGESPYRRLVLGTLHDKQRRVIDQCMAVVSRAPHSYTGEDTVEFHCHGSPAVLAAGLEALPPLPWNWRMPQALTLTLCPGMTGPRWRPSSQSSGRGRKKY